MTFKKVILIIVLTLLFIGQLPAKSKLSKLSKKHQTWLKEDVAYIITPIERKVFLKLETDKEKDMFIEAFWNQRDPNPHTEENEFKIEHYRRIKYANEHLGRGTPTAGWRTDMGRIYIILGEPNSIERHENLSLVYPMIIWFYQGLVKYGLPHAFSVVFFKLDGAGDYMLYSPVIHGPQKLLVHYHGDVNDYLRAYNELYTVNPNIAKVSVSLVEGESSTTLRPSLSSDLLISKQIPAAPTKKVNDAYATKLLKYKEFIDVDYSVNYIPNSSMVRVLRDESGIFFVHYLIEPKKLSIEQYDNDFFSNLEINGSVLDSDDKMIYQFTKSVPIKLDREQFNKIKTKLFSFQDIFPLIEGKYKINILILNVISKEFTSIEKEITVPKIEKPRISAIILAHRAEKNPKYRYSNKSFLVNGMQLLPSPRNDFVPGDTLHVYFQLYGFTDEQIKKGHINYTLYKNEKPIHTVKKNLKDYPDTTSILEEFSMEDYSAAYYNIRASVYANESQFLVLGEESFFISPIKHLPRPWVVSVSSPANSPENLNKLGIQYTNSKNYQKAIIYLERAYNRNPVSIYLALDYCRILNKLKMYQKVLNVGKPFMQTEEKNKFYALMGLASEGLGQYEPAIKYFKDYLSYHGTNLRILNLIGKCYHKLGNIEEALIAWEKSLELFPKQEKLRAFVESLKKNQEKKLP